MKTGKVKRTEYRLSFAKNVLFTLEMYAYSAYLESNIINRAKVLRDLKIAVNVRHRITHPRSPQDLMLKDSEIEFIIKVYSWFQETFIHTMKRALNELDAQISGFEQIRINFTTAQPDMKST